MSQSVDMGGTARCETPGCGWTMSASTSGSAVGHAGQHFKATGHRVVADLHRQVTFGGRADGVEETLTFDLGAT